MTTPPASFDWAGFERELTAAVVRTIGSTVAEDPGANFTAAALDSIYAEAEGVLTLPYLGVNRGPLPQLPAEEWNPADWDHYHADWLPGVGGDGGRSWLDDLTAEACRGTPEHWNATYDRYLCTLIRVCRRARTALRQAGTIDEDFPVLLFEPDDCESTLKQILGEAGFHRYFPDAAEFAAERARVAALPVTERAAFYASRLGGFDGPVDGEDAEQALRGLGRAAFPALIPMLSVPDRAWRAASLLADIGRPDDKVIDALAAALPRQAGPDQAWIARALSRLGRLDLVLDLIDRLDDRAAAAAVAAPFDAFRTRAVSGRLDYRRVEDFIARYPGHVPALTEELEPGRGSDGITVDEALRAARSPHVVIRRHAACVLGYKTDGRAGNHVLPLLGRLAANDPDPEVRRLATLSLRSWRATGANR